MLSSFSRHHERNKKTNSMFDGRRYGKREYSSKIPNRSKCQIVFQLLVSASANRKLQDRGQADLHAAGLVTFY